MTKRILCVCKGNTCRSPMFAAVLRRTLDLMGIQDVLVESAGTLAKAAGQPAAPEWAVIAKDTGIDLSGHVSRFVGTLDLGSYDTIICMESEVYAYMRARAHSKNVVVLANAPVGIDNPFERGQQAYNRCYGQINRTIAHMTEILASY